MMLIPKKGTLERVVLDMMLVNGSVTYQDFAGTEVTESNLAGIIENLKNGMFEAENDNQLKHDA